MSVDFAPDEIEFGRIPQHIPPNLVRLRPLLPAILGPHRPGSAPSLSRSSERFRRTLARYSQTRYIFKVLSRRRSAKFCGCLSIAANLARFFKVGPRSTKVHRIWAAQARSQKLARAALLVKSEGEGLVALGRLPDLRWVNWGIRRLHSAPAVVSLFQVSLDCCGDWGTSCTLRARRRTGTSGTAGNS